MGLVLIRYGEIALKGRNRPAFLRRLEHNIRACLAAHGLEGTVSRSGQRIYVKTPDAQAALDPLSRVFGIVSLSPVISVPREMDAIRAEALRQAEHHSLGLGQSFRVRVRRADKSFPLLSPEVGRLIGASIVERTGAPVDLSRAADVTIGVEIMSDEALVYGQTIQGPGGMPVGIEGRVVALLSGGIDSPVATWLMMKRGCGIIPVHLSASELGTEQALAHVAQLQRYSYAWELRPIIVDHHAVMAPLVERLQAMGEERWTCIACKRAMIVRAQAIADEYNAHGIVLGDSLGQVASQSLQNLEVISHGIDKPIYRPLIGLDKVEITDIAQRIGTLEVSNRVTPGCDYVPAHPMTRARMGRFLDLWDRLGLGGQGA
jgi:tRNA uracil 4-sulfurtransferase